MSIRRYYLGCPIWSNKSWVGELFTPDATPRDFLAQYATVFNTVEGNTTFYAVPPPTTVRRWSEQVRAGFRFSFKLPRAITHERRLQVADTETDTFFDRMSPLGTHLGPFLVQLPPSLGPKAWPALSSFLAQLPPDQHYAVEVRHPAFFDGGQTESQLDELLRNLGMDRVIFDTRALRSASGDDPELQAAQRRKPDLPVHPVALGPHPMLRYISHPTLEANRPWLSEWAARVATWIEAGKVPYVFIHVPDDFYAPRTARLFHHLLSTQVDVGEMPPWPADSAPTPPQQLPLL